MSTEAFLDEVCIIEYGARVVRKRDGGRMYPVYGGGGATFRMNVYNRKDRLVISRFAMSEECTRFVEGEFFLNDSGLTVSPLNGTLLSKFLDYQLMSLNDVIYSLGRGTAQKNLNMSGFRKLKLRIPDIAEQQRIVRILDEAFAAVDVAMANAEKKLESAKDLLESYSASIFWEETKWRKTLLKEVCTLEKRLSNNALLPFVGLEHIEANTGRLLAHARPQNVKSSTFEFSSQHVLLGRLRPYLNKVLIPDFAGRCSTEIFPIKPFPGLSREFLYYWLRTSVTVRRIVATSTGARMPRANIKQVFEFQIPLPPISEQRVIVKKLDQLSLSLDHLQLNCREKIKNLTMLKQSLLHQAFSGNL